MNILISNEFAHSLKVTETFFMKKYFIIILLISFQHLHSEDRTEILFAMDKYNEAFILADYDQIIEN